MNRHSVLLLLISLFFACDPAYSIFGAGGVHLEDYYEFARHQTGVASVQTKKFHRGEVKTSFGTANLIDVEDIAIPSLRGRFEALKGRVLITAAHVVDGSLLEGGSSVRFMDENNESHKMEVEAFYTPDNFRDTDDDIGIIVLRKSVDTTKFKPLKLNLSEEEKSLYGELVNIFGCTPVFGKVTSKVVIRESPDTLLRRGMQTVVDKSNCSELSSSFYRSQGNVRIFRDSIRTLKESHREEQHRIEEELERTDCFVRRRELREKLSKLPYEYRERLSRVFFYNENSIEDQLAMLEDTNDLDKETLIFEWKKFINDNKPGNKRFDLGNYRIKFYGPLPRLSGQLYHGDSGGAWIVGDDEIVGVSKITVGTRQRKSNFVEEKAPLTLSTNLSEYFSECERIISQSSPQNDESFLTYSASRIGGYRNWIKSTLAEINAKLNQSLPCSSSSWMF